MGKWDTVRLYIGKGDSVRLYVGKGDSVMPFTDWAHTAHSLTVQKGQNAHYMPSL